MRISRHGRWRLPPELRARMRVTAERTRLVVNDGTPPVATGTGPWSITLHVDLVNAKNAHAWTWQKRRRWAKTLRDRTSSHILTLTRAGQLPPLGRPETPKRVRFVAFVGRFLDGDGLQIALSPIRDGLQDAWIIHSDGWTSGHAFEYDQEQRPARERGVQITVERREP